VLYLILAVLVAAPILAFLGLRELHWRRRERALRDLLDGADGLEAKLQECRVRMQRLREMLTILPEEMSAEADSALRADTKVQAALKDLLAHRLWIQQHAADATQQQLDAARAALAQSSATLGAQINRLAAITADLERAQSSARTVVPRQSS
jgi:flagellin-like hook-associated protein FlgL